MASRRSSSRRSFALWAVALVGLLPVAANAAEPRPVFGELRTYIRLWEDVSPEDRASTRLRVPILQTVHVGSYATGVDGLSVEALGFGQVEGIEPFDGERWKGDLLLAAVTWRGVADNILTVRLGRQLVYAGVANHAILDGAFVGLRLPKGFGLQTWGGFVAEPAFDQSLGSWQVGGRFAWGYMDRGHIAVSYVHERVEGDPSREVLGVDASWRQFQWAQLTGFLAVDMIGKVVQEVDTQLQITPGIDWTLDLRYRRNDPAARIPKTSIFSVFADHAYDDIGGQVGWIPKGHPTSLVLGGSALLYPNDEIGMRAFLRWRWVFDPLMGNMVGVEGSRVASEQNGFWSVRLFGMVRPIERLRLGLTTEQAIYDEDVHGLQWSHLTRFDVGVNLVEGLSILADASVLLGPNVDQQWIGMIRLSYDLSGRPARGEVFP